MMINKLNNGELKNAADDSTIANVTHIKDVTLKTENENDFINDTRGTEIRKFYNDIYKDKTVQFDDKTVQFDLSNELLNNKVIIHTITLSLRILVIKFLIKFLSLLEMFVCFIAYAIVLSLPFVIIYAFIFKLLPLFTLILFN